MHAHLAINSNLQDYIVPLYSTQLSDPEARYSTLVQIMVLLCRRGSRHERTPAAETAFDSIPRSAALLCLGATCPCDQMVAGDGTVVVIVIRTPSRGVSCSM
ncbi:hypothetical protein BaRGS_00015950 [Batillaria attramentaria]|uniref:Uncharacterized protein n=1 Tax=Batillaria attramentaria TaxID=370345 RepID=A0ABD0L052_9CAEN